MSDQEYWTLMPFFDELRGDRVLVRGYKVDDAEALREAIIESREHLRPWMPWYDTHQSIEETRDWIIRQQASILLRENCTLGIWALEGGTEGRFVGGTGISVHNWKIRYFEIGYWLRKSAEGHGYVTEAARLLTGYALNEWKANRVMIRCDERNTRSAAVAHRLGYVYEGALRNDALDPDGNIRNTLYFSRIPGDA